MFYNEFAKYYDKIFPLKEMTVSFLDQRFKKGKILDVACATGNYSIALAKRGYKMTGFDLDELMISEAKDKAKQVSNAIEFTVNSMEEYSMKHPFDHAFCIGNSLVHLKSNDMIKAFLKKIYQGLNQNGHLVLQVINYDRILNHNITSLPTIHNDPYHFERRYTYDGRYIHFHTALVIEEEVLKNTVKLYPLKSKEILQILNEVGFKTIDIYGGFDESPFNPDQSIPIVIDAVKK